MFPGKGSDCFQPLEREALRRSCHPPPRRQNTRVEQGRDLSSQHGRSGPQGLERRGYRDLGHPSRFRCVCASCFRGQIGRGTALVGGHSMGAGRSMRLANHLAVRWTPLSPLLEDSPSFTIRSVRPRPCMPWNLSRKVFQGVQNRRRQPTRSCHFQCDLVASDFAQLSE